MTDAMDRISIVASDSHDSLNGQESEEVPLFSEEHENNSSEFNKENKQNLNLSEEEEEEKDVKVNLRGKTSTKWTVLICVCFSLFSTYHCITAFSSLQDDMMSQFNLSDSEFSLMTTILFVFAVFASLACPILITRTNVYITLIIGQSVLTFGQFCIMISCAIVGKHGSSIYAIYVIYFGRGLIGVGLAVGDVCVNIIIDIWFVDTKWSVSAIYMNSLMLELGVASSRYLLVLIDDINDDIWQAYLFGFFCGIIAICGGYMALLFEKSFILSHHINDNNEDGGSVSTIDHGFESDFRLIKKFDIKLWIIIFIICICDANEETYLTSMTEALMEKYNLSESEADFLLSLSVYCAIILFPIWGYISKYVSLTIYFLIASLCCMVTSMSIFVLSKSTDDGLASPVPYIAAFIQIMGSQWYYPNAWAIFFIICPNDILPVASSFTAVSYLLCGAAEIQLFGVLADLTAGYTFSMIMVAVLAFFGLVASIILAQKGFRKKTNKNK